MQYSRNVPSSSELFPDLDPSLLEIADALCAVVRSLLPEAVETFYHDAYGFGLTDSPMKRILYVAPQRGYVNLGFFFANALPDPDNLLEGSGKRMRHIKVRSVEQANSAAIAALVKAGWEAGAASLRA